MRIGTDKNKAGETLCTAQFVHHKSMQNSKQVLCVLSVRENKKKANTTKYATVVIVAFCLTENEYHGMKHAVKNA